MDKRTPWRQRLARSPWMRLRRAYLDGRFVPAQPKARAGVQAAFAFAAAVALAVAPGAARAETSVAATGFAVRLEATIQAPPARVYQAFTDEVGRWWNPEHTYSHDAANLSIDARAGGCFCEKLPAGGGVEHLRVINVAPPSLLRMSGALGPMQGSGLAGALTVQFKPVEGGTQLLLKYSVGGYLEGGFEQIAPMAEAMLAEQLARLKSYVETGKPAGKPDDTH